MSVNRILQQLTGAAATLGETMTFDEAHIAIKKGDVISLRHALDAGMVSDLSNQFSWTLLMLAAIEGNSAVAELLIARGADSNRTNDFGDTALSLAACGGHAQFVKILLAHGASVECRPHGTAWKTGCGFRQGCRTIRFNLFWTSSLVASRSWCNRDVTTTTRKSLLLTP
jgi:ankyrin repeat protein